MSVTELVIKRPTLVVVAFTVLTLLGIVCYRMLDYNLLPRFEANVITIITVYPGAGPSEVESGVTREIEDALSGLENVKSMRGTSQEGMAIVTLELKAGANVNLVLQDAQRKLNANRSKLPDDAQDPILNKFSTDEFPIMKLTVTGNRTPTELYTLVKEQVVPQIKKLSGVGEVNIVGGLQRQIHVNMNPELLRANNLSPTQVVAAIKAGNLEFPTGKIDAPEKQYSIRLAGKYKDLDQIRQQTVKTNPDGSVIKIEDIAEVEDGTADPTTMSRLDRQEAISLQIRKQTDANAVDVSKLVRAEIISIEKTFADSKIKVTIANDSSVYTLASANAVLEDLVIAIFLVALVMLVFLHSLRNSLIVLVAIPASIVSVFIAMYLMNFSLNLMTLMGLSLVVGILVDDSIVVLENITRHLEMGKDKRQAALDGRNEIGSTAAAITMVDVVVFLPLAMVQGLIGNILREFALVVVFSTLMSLVVSFTVTPLLASRFAKVEHLDPNSIMGRIGIFFENGFTSLQNLYEKILTWCLTHKRRTFLIAIVAVVASFMLPAKGFIGATFIPKSDRGEFIVRVEGSQDNSLSETNALTRQAERILMGMPEVKRIYTTVGFTSTAQSGSNNNYLSEIMVTLTPLGKGRTETLDAFQVRVKHDMRNIAGAKVSTASVGITGSADQTPVQILLRGPSIESLNKAAALLLPEVKKIPGTADVRLSVEENRPELKVDMDREKMARLGVSVADIGGLLQTSFAGNTDTKFTDKGYDFEINVSLGKLERSQIDQIRNLPLNTSRGQQITLGQVANVYQIIGTGKLERYDRISSLTINSNVIGRPIGTVGAELKTALGKIKLPEGVSIAYKGNLEQQSDAFGSLGLALAAAIIFVYLVMVALYNSYKYPFIVLFSLPLALSGALLALALAKEQLAIFSIIGLIMLMGLVAKNAILIVDFANHLRERGLTVFSALVEAGKERLRPILMTTLAMVFGMLPIAMAKGSGAEVKNGMAWVIIGGLISSLLLTLVVVPAAYYSIEIIGNKISGKKNNPDLAPGNTAAGAGGSH
ncbi:MAG: efflux RND transporter permease subunit [Bacteroidota bacterium]